MNTIITERIEGTDEEHSFDVFGKMIESRILFLTDHISDEDATDICATLLHLDSLDSEAPISLYLNSVGGDIRSVFAIFDTMQMIGAKLRTYALGNVAGESVLLLAAGTRGMRYCSPSTTICLSQIDYEGSGQGDLRTTQINIDQSKRDNDSFLAALARATRRNVKTLSRETEHPCFLTPAEARRRGIIDIVIGEKEAGGGK